VERDEVAQVARDDGQIEEPARVEEARRADLHDDAPGTLDLASHGAKSYTEDHPGAKDSPLLIPSFSRESLESRYIVGSVVKPKPPFASDLSPEEEIAAFEGLKPRLASLWNALSARAEDPFTSVVVPSMTLDAGELARLEAASFYEERLLFLLIRLRNPQAHMVYVTSQPIHPLILEYYFELLEGVPASHARSRLTLLCAHDASPRPLTEKILERPRLIQRIRYGIRDSSRAYLTIVNATPLERRLAVLLGIPMNGVDPALQHLGTKSGSRKVFREAGVPMPPGFEDIRSPENAVEALAELKEQNPKLRRAVIKMNEGFSGGANAIFRYPHARGREAIRQALDSVSFSEPAQTPESYFARLGETGGIIEELVEGGKVASPSAQLRIDPYGEVELLSTHDQILGGPAGQTYLGCRFPADDADRTQIAGAARRIGETLAGKGVVSRFGIDFLCRRREGSGQTDLFAIEINLRIGGTTHPFLALRFLTGGRLDPETGLFHSRSGHPKFYRSTDNLKSSAYRGLCPEDLIDITTVNRLNYNHGTETGVLFHMIGALSQYGKLGLTAIGNSHVEADAIYARTLDLLDRETGVTEESRGSQE
jgi:PGM1 C-terminal domain